MQRSEQINEIAKALSMFQGKVKNPQNTATNPQFRSKYAPLDVVINTTKPILDECGLSVIQSTSSQGEMIGVQTMIMHTSGQFIESDVLWLPAYQTKGGGVKDFNAQGCGSAITYGRRYQYSSMLGITSEDDDDGNHASHNHQPEKKQEQKPPQNQPAGKPLKHEMEELFATVFEPDKFGKWYADQMKKRKNNEQEVFDTLKTIVEKEKEKRLKELQDHKDTLDKQQ